MEFQDPKDLQVLGKEFREAAAKKQCSQTFKAVCHASSLDWCPFDYPNDQLNLLFSVP